MNVYQKENNVMQQAAQELISIVNKRFGKRLVVKSKHAPDDVASTLDWAADRLLVKTITKNFPKDTLLTEESSPDALIGPGRTWVIDPICGSRNLSKGLRVFVSNIALVEGDKVVAAWVVDHSRQRVLWDIGTGLHDGSKKVPHLSKTKSFPTVEIDWGHFYAVNAKVRRLYVEMASQMRLDRSMNFIELVSSLGFAYVATGQFQATICININAWDFAAPCFLVEQNGGIVTNFDGSPWSLKSRSIVMAATPALHKKLLTYIRAHHLQNIK